MDLSAKVYWATEVRIWTLAIAVILALVSFLSTWAQTRWQAELSEQKEAAAQARERRHDEEMARLHLQTADANKRATEAALELERLKRPRLLLPDQQDRLIKAAGSFSGQIVAIGAVPTTFEATAFAEQLVRVLVTAGLNSRIDQQLAATEVGSSRGVVARFVTGNLRGEELAKALSATLSDEGISAHAVGGREEEFVLKYNWNREDASLNPVVIVVGDKE
jgi:hypothetical protein